MRLLVSVGTGAEASAATAGHADLIDAKNPAAGALGAVTRDTLIDIHRVVAGARPITAALGDAADEASIERSALSFAATGTLFVKIGFAGIRDAAHITALIQAAVRGARAGSEGSCGVVAVGYADSDVADSITPLRLVKVAASASAAGVLMDTADKRGPGLRGLVGSRALTQWSAEAHDAGLLVALAGKLTSEDLPFVRDAGADIAGFRGAACDGGRTGRVSCDKVRRLHALCHREEHHVTGWPRARHEPLRR